jgi:predicted ester cyclase
LAHEAILEQLRRPISVEEYGTIRDTWKRHSIAEDDRDLPGLMATLTEDCVYQLVQTGHTWRGHAGATAFYLELLGAFPDVVFDLTDIVIGPQGVCEVADVTATHRGTWLGGAPTGRPVAWRVVIFFPWDPEARLFRGEKVWSHSDDPATLRILAGEHP